MTRKVIADRTFGFVVAANRRLSKVSQKKRPADLLRYSDLGNHRTLAYYLRSDFSAHSYYSHRLLIKCTLSSFSSG